MSVAWSSLVVLLLLLPGVVFSVGLYLPEKFTRESIERSPIGQLATVLLVSIIVHAILFAVNKHFLSELAPRIDLAELIRAMTLDQPGNGAAGQVGRMLDQYMGWILAYLICSVGLGVLIGVATGFGVVKIGRPFAQHSWVFDLSVGDSSTEKHTVAYVMTHVRQNEKVLMYHGFLKSFALKRDGTFAYMVLTRATRGYMVLGDEAPETQTRSGWRKIGEAPHSISARHDSRAGRSRAMSYFVIEGEDISNAVFDRFELQSSNAEELDAAFEKALKELEEMNSGTIMVDFELNADATGAGR